MIKSTPSLTDTSGSIATLKTQIVSLVTITADGSDIVEEVADVYSFFSSDDSSGFKYISWTFLPLDVTISSTSTASSASTGPTSPRSRSTIPPAPTPTPETRSGLSKGTVAGISIAVIAGVSIITVLAWLVLHYRRKALNRTAKGDSQDRTNEVGDVVASHELSIKPELESVMPTSRYALGAVLEGEETHQTGNLPPPSSKLRPEDLPTSARC
ncbi:hypothetical protein F4780DRAFT_523326 [Xylariomycetidae sp. FL0641]|nr:hypothetical protein F4780DRAFT_523326 [Xylariomycetidae sp. FL0641]